MLVYERRICKSEKRTTITAAYKTVSNLLQEISGGNGLNG